MSISGNSSENSEFDGVYGSSIELTSPEYRGSFSIAESSSDYALGVYGDEQSEQSEMDLESQNDNNDYYKQQSLEIVDGSQFEELVTKQKRNSSKLLGSGKFGFPEGLVRIDGGKLSDASFHRRLLLTRLRGYRCLPLTTLSSAFVPNSRGKVFNRYSSRVYSGQFSQDGTFFYSCTQDFKLRVFDVVNDELSQKKEVQAFVGQWTITDATLSNDNKWLAYSSITPLAFLTKSSPSDTEQFPLIFSEEDRFGIWSLRFSATGNELVAGTSNDSVMILDIETGKVVFCQKGHRDDVNAVSIADPTSNVIFSGSDDGLIKVWDRRSMHGENCSPAGTLVGHTSGVTFVSTKGDGRYCLSNGKDQTMKLWDIRKLVSMDKSEPHYMCDYTGGYDYRWMDYPYLYPRVHPYDVSVMTYRGHKVTSTLIRCYFSPAASTGQKYVYSGSSDGRVHIYSLNGDVVRILDSHLAIHTPDDGKTCAEAMASPEGALLAEAQASAQNSRHFTSLLHSIRFQGTSRPSYIVARDVSWHPYHPYLITSCWVGDMGRLVKHSYTTPESHSL